ncbi:proteasome subunit beta [Nitrospira moscoviensis]|uniref:Proteasome subunit beta n=1 Tax=Nitrospira moscoviensis TaxID=42253 RepID=A0A0K2GG69_NITMO|nr:proteasome subunit beta [Nitrospira moscoviensis]ALA59943.1 Proteasome subunit beta [Nitrospira moscoviensis]
MKLPFFPNHDESSFFHFLSTHYPDLTLKQDGLPAARPVSADAAGWTAPIIVPQATTVLAIKYQQGAVIAGDRRATEGFQIADRRIEKVFKIDDYSAMAIAGAAGPCIEMAKLFQTELEHYEKLEGMPLSCEGKANKLGQMVKANLPMVFQGLVVMPLYVGYDLKRTEGRIFKYDITGGRYEESDYHAIGSGGKDARNTMREHFKKGLSENDVLELALLSLYNAADDDVGTGGPDLIRGIYPTAKLVTASGITDVSDGRIRDIYDELMKTRRFREG